MRSSRRRGCAGLFFLIERHLLRERSGDARALVHAPEVGVESLHCARSTPDHAFAARIARSRRSGELSADADPAKLAKLASATLYSLTIHARADEGRSALKAIADAAVDVICGPRKGGRRKKER